MLEKSRRFCPLGYLFAEFTTAFVESEVVLLWGQNPQVLRWNAWWDTSLSQVHTSYVWCTLEKLGGASTRDDERDPIGLSAVAGQIIAAGISPTFDSELLKIQTTCGLNEVMRLTQVSYAKDTYEDVLLSVSLGSMKKHLENFSCSFVGWVLILDAPRPSAFI